MFLIKVPTSQGGMHKAGSETAPEAIVDAMYELFLTESGFKHNFVVDEVKIAQNNIEETNDKIFRKAEEALSTKAVFLGGDHSITFPIFKAFAKIHKNPGMVVFDAHPDCVNEFHPPSHEDWLRTLIEEGVLKPENVIIVAVRNMDDTERQYVQKKGIRIFGAEDIMNNIENACDSIMVQAVTFDALYISIDIDAADPAFAPGTGYIEPGGLSTRELIYFVHRLKILKNFRAADIVEVNPQKDFNGMTAKLAAKLAVEMW